MGYKLVTFPDLSEKSINSGSSRPVWGRFSYIFLGKVTVFGAVEGTEKVLSKPQLKAKSLRTPTLNNSTDYLRRANKSLQRS